MGYHRQKIPLLIACSAHSLMVASFLLWGGLGRLDTPEAPEFLNMIRPQDILTVVSSLFLILCLAAKRRLPQAPFVQAGAVVLLLIHGMVMGLLNGNTLRDIAFEGRLCIYALSGTLVGILIYPSTISRMIQRYAAILSAGIVVQFILSLARVDFTITSGFNPGNAFTLNLPMVRPPGGFHLVAIGLILAIEERKRRALDLPTIITILALIITQSKTYWGILLFIIFFGAMLGNVRNLRNVLHMINRGFIVLMLSSIVLGLGSLLLGMGWTFSLPLEKFRLFLTDPEIAYGVVGKRVQEMGLLVNAWSDSVRSVLLGSGWGYIYRDPHLLFYRSDPRDQEILGMFGHNFFLWLLVKIGLIGFLVFAGTLILSLSIAFRGGHSQRRLGIGLVALCCSSVLLGSPENPTGAFLLGLLLAGTTRYEYDKTFEGRSEDGLAEHRHCLHSGGR